MNQKAYEIIVALSPLNKLFGQLSQQKQEIYAEKLQKYDIDLIKRAVSKVQDVFIPTERNPFPAIATIIKACEIIQGNGESSRGGDLYPWLTRQREQAKLVSNYIFHYRGTPLFRQAQAEGWEHYLLSYVYEVASIQAQIIHARPGGAIGLDWCKIQIDGLSKEDAGHWQKNFLAECARQVNFNGKMIDVNIPAEKIDEFRRRIKIRAVVNIPASATPGLNMEADIYENI